MNLYLPLLKPSQLAAVMITSHGSKFHKVIMCCQQHISRPSASVDDLGTSILGEGKKFLLLHCLCAVHIFINLCHVFPNFLFFFCRLNRRKCFKQSSCNLFHIFINTVSCFELHKEARVADKYSISINTCSKWLAQVDITLSNTMDPILPYCHINQMGKY